jgi:hypothetical protein
MSLCLVLPTPLLTTGRIVKCAGKALGFSTASLECSSRNGSRDPCVQRRPRRQLQRIRDEAQQSLLQSYMSFPPPYLAESLYSPPHSANYKNLYLAESLHSPPHSANYKDLYLAESLYSPPHSANYKDLYLAECIYLALLSAKYKSGKYARMRWSSTRKGDF